ncbi:MAG TPA: hypothetical protein VHB21_13165 [Minicystis sp.]|nr:hypothetical protein [Minicystis sp.]
MNHVRYALLAFALIGLPACEARVAGPAIAVPEVSVSAVEDVSPVVVTAAPPPLRYEVVPRPIVGRVWVPGYWHWGPRGYIWAPGRYVVARPGYRWIAPRYVWRGGYHYYYGGHWIRR